MTANDPAACPVGPTETVQSSPTQATDEVPPFEILYEQYFDFVWCSARRLGVTHAHLDDVVQEIFIVIHAKVHTLREPAALRSWVYGVVRRTVSEHHRSRRTRDASGVGLVVQQTLEQSLPKTPLDLSEQNAQVKLLFSLLDELDAPKREVFILVELEEMSVPEVAEALEVPLNTAYSRLRAARQAFEAALARRARSQTAGQR